MTIKTLEMATMRSVKEALVEKHLDKLKSIAGDLFSDMRWIDNYCNGFVDTNFQTDHTELKRSIRKAYPNDDFPLNPNLPEGKEWLAFTFRAQKSMINDIKELERYLEFSEDILVQAYSNMKLEKHAWTKHTVSEVDFIQQFLPATGKIMDFGCGVGRHCIEFAKRGWQTYGIDFCASHISTAIEMAKKQNVSNAHFCYGDARNHKALVKMNAILCLYDVVGSFPSDVDNLQILKNAYKNLHNNGVLILSVMNMTLTSTRCRKNTVYGIENHIDRLLKLEGTNTMQKTGDIFNGKHLLLDDYTGVVYRKEQFFW